MRLSLEKGLSLEEEKENRLKKLTYARDVMNWTADEEGNVYGKFGKKLGCLDKDSYLISTYRIKKKTYSVKLHQFVYFYFTGEVVDRIDHDNRNKFDNRLENLNPDLTNQQNLWNTNAKGYYWYKARQKWHAQIMINGKSIFLGYFSTKEEAHQAYLAAKKKYHII